MSSTRKAKDDSIFHQNRYASSPEFERGISATMTAKRCSILDKSEERLLVWFVQWLSWQPGELEKLFALVNPKFGYRIFSREDLIKLCVDPDTGANGALRGTCLVDKIREYRRAHQKRSAVIYNTALGQKVFEVLDYTSFSRGLTLMEGEARTGKSFAARAWCEQRAGGARFIEVPPGNDDSGFFRALARGLGIGSFLQYTTVQIRERVEAVLLSHDLNIVLDEAQRLWPQRNLRYGFPGRIVWVMSMANAGVPIAMISTQQFIETQKLVEKTGWNGKQLTGRIKHYEPLPLELSHEDLISVARAVLPEAKQDTLKALAIYARNSARYLAAIDSISTRARYLAEKDGREKATTGDVQRAMKESVIPADSKLQSALAAVRNSRQRAQTILVEEHASEAGGELPTPRERHSLTSARPLSAPELVS